MFAGRSTAFAKSISLWAHSLSPFSLWAIHAGWLTTSAIAGLIFTVKIAGLFVSQGAYTDPFVKYDALLPGNPVEAVADYPCSFSENRINGQLVLDHLTCVILPKNEPFDIIHVEIRNERIQSVTFYTKNLLLGDAALHWQGSRLPSGHTQVTWNAAHYSIEALGPSLCYQCGVRSPIKSENVSCRRRTFSPKPILTLK